jgi:hypothetical protein
LAAQVRVHAPTLGRTYPVSLAIMFLDRYGSEADKPLIRQLGVRLAASQFQPNGAWGYESPVLSGPQHADWLRLLAARRRQANFGAYQGNGLGGDNSNTQFAILALWIARRHGVPVEHPLALTEWRFRSTQGDDGGWSYSGDRGDASSPAMTCAGLLGLAVGHGSAKARQQQAPDIRVDRQVTRAKSYLARQLAQERRIPSFMYFVWSLERVGVAYGFDDLNGTRWYDWGAALLLASQQGDGSWSSDHGALVGTAFALLFLRKANLVTDLTADISGEANLRSGTGDPKLEPARPADPPRERPRIDKELAPAEAKKLLAELPRAKPQRQEQIIQRLQETIDASGSFTDALLTGIRTTDGELRDKLREALSQRLSRQSTTAVREWLGDSDADARAAAARAAAIKDEKSLVPELIELLADKEDSVATAAENALVPTVEAPTQSPHSRD